MPCAAFAEIRDTAAPLLATIDIKTLLDEHDRIDLLSERIVEQSAATPADIPGTIATLLTLSTLVTEHLRAEDISIYPMLASLIPTPHLRDVEQAIANFEGLCADWIDFLGEWTSDCVESDWEGFGEAARTMLARLRARVHWETSLIYPYALRIGAIRLRPAPANA